MSKVATIVLLAVFVVYSFIIVETVLAQSMLTPSVPEFTVKAVDSAIEVTIRNQPLDSYENGSCLYYGFKFKDFNARVGFWEYDPSFFVGPSTYGGYYKASDSDFSVVLLSLEGYDFPSGQVDIQAIALVGNQYQTDIQNGTVYGFDGLMSGWSETQTITMGESQTSPEPTPTPTPSEEATPLPTINTGPSHYYFDDFLIGGIAGAVAIAVLVLLYYLTKRK